MKYCLSLLYTNLVLLLACTQKQAAPERPLSQEEIVSRKLDSLKRAAQNGDLVVRLGDDLLSYQIKFLNETDKNWSHAGTVIEKGGQKMVAHITPDNPEIDGVQYTAIDSFLNPQKNLACGLYRYDFTAAERDSFAGTIERYHAAHIPFDRVYDLATDSTLYCSEMISKAATKATGGRLQFRQTGIPSGMVTALHRVFKKELSKETIAARKIMTIDNLYRVPGCQVVMRFPLKILPSQ